MCDSKLFASHVTRHPYFYGNRHRSSPDSFYSRITSNCVPYPHRFEKRHSFHRHCNDPRLCGFRRKNSAAQVHLRGQPPAENVAIWIGVLRHRNRLNNQLASGLVGHFERIIAQSATWQSSSSSASASFVFRRRFSGSGRGRGRVTGSACNRRSCKSGNARESPPDKP